MAIALPKKLIVTYDIYKQHNGFQIPVINDEDEANGITTPEIKYEKWAKYTQIQLNAILQDKLLEVDYDIEQILPIYQTTIIDIMVTRLARAFYNDELLPRNSRVNFSQQGGVQYASDASIDPKNAPYTFFDGAERLLIENSGLLEDAITYTEDDLESFQEDNEFKDGVFVIDVNWGDKAENIITFQGNNISLYQAILNLDSQKLTKTDLPNLIKDMTGLTVDDNLKVIQTKTGYYIKYETYRVNKTDEELAQMQDVSDSEARSRQSIVENQKNINDNKTLISINKGEIDALKSLELAESIVNDEEHDLVGLDNEATFDLKSITADDGNGNQLPIFNNFSADVRWTIELYEPIMDAHSSQTFNTDKSGTYHFSQGNQSDAFVIKISNTGFMTVTRKNGNTPTNSLKISQIIESGVALNNPALQSQVNKKVSKQLIQGAQGDFETLDDLKALINDDDFIALSLSSGIKITGRISNTGKTNPGDSIFIDGSKTENSIIKFGTIQITDTFSVTGGYDITTGFKDINVNTYAFSDTDLGKRIKMTSSSFILTGFLQKSNGYKCVGNFGVNDKEIGFFSWNNNDKPNIFILGLKLDGTDNFTLTQQLTSFKISYD